MAKDCTENISKTNHGKCRSFVKEAERIYSESTMEKQGVSDTVVWGVQRLLS